MFERRLRIVLVVLVLAALTLLTRAGHVQLAQAGLWRSVAYSSISRSELTETTRGRLLDAKGRVLAEDVPCNDAAVAYWFITEEPDADRLYQAARSMTRREVENYMSLSREEQHKLVLGNVPRVRQQLEEMWDTLARVGGMTRAEIDEARQQIITRVEYRRGHIMEARYKAAVRDHDEAGVPAWWRRWLLGEADAPPEIEEFEEPIAEELQAHVIVSNLAPEAYNELRKRQDDLPGLSLIANRTRHYPAGPVAAHVVGHLNSVEAADLKNDPELGNERRAYLPRDQMGKSGLEKLAEQSLRGTRGRIDRDLETERSEVAFEPEPGADVTTNIDLALQADLREAFRHVAFEWPDEKDGLGRQTVHSPAPGAAVVIDVKTGAIRALVSYPDFDPNTYAKDLPRLVLDDINRPLSNRAAQFAVVPGSTIKPVIGLAAIAEGVLHPHETIECDGYLYFRGKRLSYLRCWTASMYDGMGLDHHQGGRDPHPTNGLNPGFSPPSGHLTLADAIQRSCNVFFENIAMRLGEERLNHWMKAFGLGEPTGSGLNEASGSLLSDMPANERADPGRLRGLIFSSGIGQGYVQATPLQMANVAATIARGGVVIQPTLLESDIRKALAEKRDLNLNPAALEMVQRGMFAAVNTPAGSGSDINSRLPLPIAGKTGSAQASPLTVPQRDADGEFIRNPDGSAARIVLDHSTRDSTNPLAPWFRRVNPMYQAEVRQSHGWFIGYAPADNPQVAFAVFIEYGGSGGTSAASVVVPLVESLVRHGYLQPTRQPREGASADDPRYVTEPLSR